MKIRGYVKTYHQELEIHPFDAVEALRDELRKKFEVKEGAFIEDGFWKRSFVTYGASHSDLRTTTLREATEEEKIMWTGVMKIRELFLKGD